MAQDDGTQTPQTPQKIQGNNQTGRTRSSVTFELYETMWKFYRDSDRKPTTLVKQFGLSKTTILKVIHQGYPDNEWLSFKERAAVWDKTRMNQDDYADAKAYSEVHEQWATAKRDNLKLAAASKGAIIHALRSVLQACQQMKFVKYRREADPLKPGFRHTIEIPMNGHEISDSLRLLAHAVKDIGMMEAFWLGGKAPADLEAPLRAWSGLTPEQMDYIYKTGQLPPGVTDEMLFGFGLPMGPESGGEKN